ncbi:DUF1345 domain-containing protein [Kocuria rhizophila]|uniref:DUF1345 domain-containing protein n=1 Tax=Kocuria rhizophila TaxID=72000 RepID=UPI000C8762EA|nr:DUF1345 domain-containing protein [Kocuria rhizophila]MBK4120409.1 DUF1345 domain-containing protein [Kocuria rhizophila]MCT1917363.1 DUF1345 domain-containing protein [Kocuria rhizophila]MCT1956881.1 DUF1345 domain-containing protein [Kocuria rhizophila]MCT2073342.1 DUF1345 domain-containing protein [Kocuria rhizophila]PMR90379.1 DUF1345 domain-containing protein [Kocuria rhizophila]
MTSTERRPLSAHLRLAIAVAVGVVAGGMASLALDGLLAVLVGACGVSLAYVVLAVSVLWPMDAARTRSNSVREDFQPLVQEATVVALSLVNLLTIMVILVRGGTETRTTGAVLGLLGILLTWAMLHLMYGARYAHEYYRHPQGGIDFNDDEPPRYVDFLYFSFNLGMTFQVSDTNVSTTRLRAVILRHCLLSYIFSTVILAATVNVVLGVLPG